MTKEQAETKNIFKNVKERIRKQGKPN